MFFASQFNCFIFYSLQAQTSHLKSYWYILMRTWLKLVALVGKWFILLNANETVYNFHQMVFTQNPF